MPTISAIATAVITLLNSLLPLLGSSSTGMIGTIIATLTQLLPVVVQEATDLVQPVKNIIAALQSNSASTAEQLATLAALDAQCDAAFETAATNAGISPDTGV